MDETAVSQVEFEIQQIDRLLDSYGDLLQKVRQRPPDLVETAAVASVLHSFYNGLENIFTCIAKRIDKDMPSGDRWHRDLLLQMASATDFRKPVLSGSLVQRLSRYLGFRHFYRHSYSFFLSWDELEDLTLSLPDVWEGAKQKLVDFLRSATDLRASDRHEP